VPGRTASAPASIPQYPQQMYFNAPYGGSPYSNASEANPSQASLYTQQQLYQGYYAGASQGYGGYPQPARGPPIKRESKALQIIDPKTNKPIAPSPSNKEAAPKPVEDKEPSENLLLEALKNAKDTGAEQEAKLKAEQTLLAAEETKKKLQQEQEKEIREKEETALKVKAENLAKAAEEEKLAAALDSLSIEKTQAEVQEKTSVPEKANVVVKASSSLATKIPNFKGATGKIVYHLEDMLAIKEEHKETPESLKEVDFTIVFVRPGMAPRGGGAFQGGRNDKPQQQQQWQRGVGAKGGSARGGKAPIGGLEVKPIVIGENAWKPTQAQDDLEGTVKKLKGILNKLTLEKFDKLSQLIIDIPMTSVAMIKETVTAVFDKALAEPNFGELYARLCRVIVEQTSNNQHQKWSFVTIEEKDGEFFWTTTNDETEEDATRLVGPFITSEEATAQSKKMTDFKRILLNKCQEEFQRDNQIADADEKVVEVKALVEAETDPTKASELKVHLQEVTYEALKTKRKVLGNIQFIGELYKQKILTEKVMHGCIHKLLIAMGPNDKTTTENGQKVPEDEEMECLAKLLITIGSTLDNPQQRTLVDEYFLRLRNLSTYPLLQARHKFMLLDVIELRQNNWTGRREELKAKKIEDVHKDAKREEQEKARQASRAGSNNNRNANQSSRQGRSNNNSRSGLGNVASASHMGSGGGSKIGGASSSRKPGVSGPRPTSAVARGGAGGGGSTSFRPGGSIAKPSKKNCIDRATMVRKVDYALQEYVGMQVEEELLMSLKEIADVVETKEEFQQYLVNTAISMVIEKKDDERRYIPQALSAIVKESELLEKEALVDGIAEKLANLSEDKMDSPKADTHVAHLLVDLVTSQVLQVGNLAKCLVKLLDEAPHVSVALLALVLKFFQDDEESASIFQSQKSDFVLKEFFNGDEAAANKFKQEKGLEPFLEQI